MIKFYTIFLTLLLAGCGSQTPQKSEIYKSKNTLSSVLEIPMKIQMLNDRFVKKFELKNRAEYYKQSEKVGFSWEKMITINHSKKTKISEYKTLMQNKLDNANLGKARLELNETSSQIIQGYVVLEPSGNFREYEISLVQAKQLECGLIDIRYAFKVEQKYSDQIEQMIDENMKNFIQQIPKVECR